MNTKGILLLTGLALAVLSLIRQDTISIARVTGKPNPATEKNRQPGQGDDAGRKDRFITW